MTLTNWNQTLKDVYALPGTRLKQWVVDMRELHAWENATAPLIPIDPHEDNTGVQCSERGRVRWHHLEMAHCCSTCGAIAEKTRTLPKVAAWIAERAARPPVCADKSKLSDEVSPEWPVISAENPLFKALTRSKR